MQLKSVILCLATEKGYAVAQSLGPFTDVCSLTITTFREGELTECFHDRIVDEAKQLGIRHVSFPEWRRSAPQIVSEVNADAIICIGWRYLIPDDVASQVGGNVIVAHDSLLPKLRGFAPLPTAIISGERAAGVTFLRANPEVDAGPIYWQQSISICDNDCIRDLIQKTIPLYIEGVGDALQGRFFDPIPQIHEEATYSVWRDADDYFIDWTLSAEKICRTVRALGPPYLGACAYLGDQKVTVVEASVISDLPFAIRQPGKVWRLDSEGRPIIICGTGMLRLESATLSDGQTILPMTRMRVRFQ